MKCEECQAAIEDYIDEALAVRAARELEEHLSACAICSRCLEGFKREQAIYASYQREVDLTPALWAGIEARITREQVVKSSTFLETLRQRFAGMFGAPRFSAAFAAALVLLAIGVTALVMSLMSSRSTVRQIADNDTNLQPPAQVPSSSNPPPSATEGPAKDVTEGKNTTQAPPPRKAPVAPNHLIANARPTPERLVREAQEKYLQAIAILSKDVNARRSQIDPAVLARFDAALSDIDRTIAETKQAARQNPGDPIALQYLLAAYSKKVDALREMARD